MPTISDITPSPRSPQRLIVRVDGRRAAAIPAHLLPRLDLAVGQPWTESLAQRLAGAVTLDKLRSAALRAAAARPITRTQLLRKLRRRYPDLPQHDLDAAADHAASVGLINDEAFAADFARSQIAARPAGRALLLAKLRARGIAPATATRAADAALAAADQSEAILALAGRRVRAMPPSLEPAARRRRLYAFLARRGFDPDTARQTVNAVIPG